MESYLKFFGDRIFWMTLFRTLIFAAVFTLSTLLITYPVAYFLARHVSRKNQMLMLLILLIPFWVGEIVRTYAIMILLGNTGALNLALKWLGLIDRPIPFMYRFSMGLGIVYLTALYMLLPLYSALEKLPKSYNEAAADLGAGAWTRFRRVTLPLTIEGISSGCTLVFLISTGFYATPVLLGGPSTTVFAETIAGFFHVAGDEWPTGAAFAVIMFLVALLITAFSRLMKSLRKEIPRESGNRIALACIYWAFVLVFVPLILMILVGFKDSKFIGFPIRSWTLDWYTEFFRMQR